MYPDNFMTGSGDYGWMEVICGSMFSGKTEELIRRLKRAKIAKQKVEIFKPSSDVRYSENSIVSHDENALSSTLVESSNQILLLTDDTDVVGIDEAQFFDQGIVEVCNTLANRGKRVVIAGLDMDFRGKPFGPMPELMATAEFVTKVHAVCVKSGKMAHYSHRLSKTSTQFELGSHEEYEPLSRAEFNKINKP